MRIDLNLNPVVGGKVRVMCKSHQQATKKKAKLERAYTLLVKVGVAAKKNFQDVQTLLKRVAPVNLVLVVQQLFNIHQVLGGFIPPPSPPKESISGQMERRPPNR